MRRAGKHGIRDCVYLTIGLGADTFVSTQGYVRATCLPVVCDTQEGKRWMLTGNAPESPTGLSDLRLLVLSVGVSFSSD